MKRGNFHGLVLLRLPLAVVLIAVLLWGVLAQPPRAEAVLTFSSDAPGFIEELVVGNLPFITAIAWAHDGRMFIAQKDGIVRIYQNNTFLATPFIDIRGEVNNVSDRGLLGLAVHPNFPTTPYVYLLYTYDPPGLPGASGATDGQNGSGGRVARLVRVTANASSDYNTASPSSSVILLGANSTFANIGNPLDGRDTTKASCMVGKSMSNAPVEDCIPSDETTHSIGTVTFGTDGSLFVSVGDAANYIGVDPRALRSLNIDSLAGKVLRIDPNTGRGLPNNPFYNAANPNSNRSKVYSYGLRNPFRISINPATNEPFIGDVGWNSWEEINTGKGANFGWPCYEGGMSGGATEGSGTTSLQQGSYRTNETSSAACANLYAQGLSAVQRPFFSYRGGGAAANAGAFYTGTAYPSRYQGAMFMLDYSRRWIRYLTFDANGTPTINNFAGEGTSGIGPVQIAVGTDSNLYLVMHRSINSEIRRIRYIAGGNTPPTVVAGATPVGGEAPLNVAFSSAGTLDPDAQPLTYAWSFGDGGTSNQPNPSHTYTTPGTYDAVLTVTETTSPFASRSQSVRITVGSPLPVARILTPADGTTYQIGDVINYSGSGLADGQPVAGSGLAWELRLHHNDHLHYDSLGTGSSGSFVITEHGDETWYELCLTVTASADLLDTQCSSLRPRKTTYTLDSEPRGMTIVYQDEGKELATRSVITPIVNSVQQLTVDPIQRSRSFAGWSDGVTGTSREFIVGTTPLTFTARFENRLPTARAVITPLSGVAPLVVSFDGRNSSDPEGDALSYLWEFGDGMTFTQAQTSYTYNTPGQYIVNLTVTDTLGGTNRTSQLIIVQNSSPNVPPTPTLTRTATSTATALPPTSTATSAAQATATSTATPTATALPPTSTATSAAQATATSTATPTATAQATATSTATPTATAQASSAFAVDSFSRTVASGWGSAETGGAYSILGPPADFAVTGTSGTLRVTAADSARTVALSGLSAQDADFTVRVQADKTAVGGSQFVQFIARRVAAATEYRGRMRFAPDGRVWLMAEQVADNIPTVLGTERAIPDLSYTPGQALWLRMQVEGRNPTTLRLKAWAEGQSEPNFWLVSITDSTPALQTAGSVGLRAFLSKTVTNQPVRFTFDDFRVVPIGGATSNPVATPTMTATAQATATSTATSAAQATATSTATPTATAQATATSTATPTATAQATATPTATAQASSTPFAVDSFSRTVASGWGSAETGGTYSILGPPADFAVTGTSGTLRVAAANSARTAVLGNVTVQDADFTVRVQADKTAVGGSQFVQFIARRTAATEYRGRMRFAPDGRVWLMAEQVADNIPTVLGTERAIPDLNYTPGQALWLRMQVEGRNPTTLRLKAWAEGQSEPNFWLVSTTDNTPALQAAGSVGLRAFLSGTVTNQPVRFTFDDFRVVPISAPQ